jgi:hypothetical protein
MHATTASTVGWIEGPGGAGVPVLRRAGAGAVKGRDVLGVEQPVDLRGEAIALVLEVFDLLAADRGVRLLGPTAAGFW